MLWNTRASEWYDASEKHKGSSYLSHGRASHPRKGRKEKKTNKKTTGCISVFQQKTTCCAVTHAFDFQDSAEM